MQRTFLLISILLGATVVTGQPIQESPAVEASLSDFCDLHPLVVHIPIVLLLLPVGTVLKSVDLFWLRARWMNIERDPISDRLSEIGSLNPFDHERLL